MNRPVIFIISLASVFLLSGTVLYGEDSQVEKRIDDLYSQFAT